MLDTEKKVVCRALIELCKTDGVFRVVEAEEIMNMMPDVYLTKAQLSSIIRDLKERNYIRVKYFTPDEYCIQVLPIVEKEFEEEKPAILPIEALEQGQTDVVAGEHIDPVVESEATIVSTTKQTNTENVPSKFPLKVFLAALFGSMLGGGIIAAVAILLQKFL